MIETVSVGCELITLFGLFSKRDLVSGAYARDDQADGLVSSAVAEGACQIIADEAVRGRVLVQVEQRDDELHATGFQIWDDFGYPIDGDPFLRKRRRSDAKSLGRTLLREYRLEARPC